MYYVCMHMYEYVYIHTHICAYMNILRIWLFCLPVWRCIICVPSAHRGQKRTSNCCELELLLVGNHVDAASGTQSWWTSVFKHRVNALAPGFVLTSDTWTHVCFFLSLRIWDTWLCMCVYLQALIHICPWLKAYTDVSKCLWIQNAHYEQNRWSFNSFI